MRKVLERSRVVAAAPIHQRAASARWALRSAAPEPVKAVAVKALEAVDPIRVRRFRARTGEQAPIPPRRLRIAPDLDAYAEDGRRAADELERALRTHARPLEDFSAILDFGCGAGRVLTHVEGRVAPGSELSGSDIDAGAVSWLRATYPARRFAVNGASPPLPFPDAAFDLVFAISVFTHLDESDQMSWLEELRRVLRPDGLAALSVHGQPILDAYLEGRRPGATSELRGRLAGRSLPREGFIYEPYRSPDRTSAGSGGTGVSGGLAFHSSDYVRGRWREVLPVRDILPAAINWRQDLVLLGAS